MRNRRPSKFRRVAKWVLLGACLGLSSIWVVTLYQPCMIEGGTYFDFGGSKWLIVPGGMPLEVTSRPAPGYWTTVLGFVPLPTKAYYSRHAAGANEAMTTYLMPMWIPLATIYVIPMWIPLGMCVVTTACFWYRDRGERTRYRLSSRLRRVAKWAGVFLCSLILLTWGCTSRSAIIYYTSTHSVIGVGAGRVIWGVVLTNESPGWQTVNAGGKAVFWVWPPITMTRWVVVCANWFLFAVIAPIVIILWHRDRRTVPLGHCLHCGYNLTGNESGVCPECSTPVPKQVNNA